MEEEEAVFQSMTSAVAEETILKAPQKAADRLLLLY